jgi:hypothetical protein
VLKRLLIYSESSRRGKMQTIQTDAMKKIYHEKSACGAAEVLSLIRKPMLYPLSYSPVTSYDTTSVNSSVDWQ